MAFGKTESDTFVRKITSYFYGACPVFYGGIYSTADRMRKVNKLASMRYQFSRRKVR